jgi:hypothetical protein
MRASETVTNRHFLEYPELPALQMIKAGSSLGNTVELVVMMLWWLLAFIQKLERHAVPFLKLFSAPPGIESARNAHFLIVKHSLYLHDANAWRAPASLLTRYSAPVLARI